MPAIAAQLHVGTILEGSLRRSGNQLRIAVQLVSAADGYHLRPAPGVTYVQEDGAMAVEIKHTINEIRARLQQIRDCL